ncbi:MAG: ATP-binding protein [Ignavibacteriales bacterium]|nr:ATP-binding protein [Ignavibacteriales bacterium]
MLAQTLKNIKENKLFKNIKEEEFNLHLSPDNLLYKLRGDVIYREGDVAENIFLIINGEARIVKERLLGMAKRVIRSENDFLGEEDFLENMPRSSTAFALKDCKLVVLERAEIDFLISDNEKILENLKRESDEIIDLVKPASSNELKEAELKQKELEKDINGTDFIKEKDFDFNKMEAPVIENEGSVEQKPVHIELGTNAEAISKEEAEPVDKIESKQLSDEQLHLIIRAAQSVNSNIKLEDVLKSILDSAQRLTHAERGTLYLVDRAKEEIWSKVLDGDNITEVRLRIGEGIAGWVAQNKEVVNIGDVKNDARFNQDYDKTSGFQTRNMLCFPIKNKSDEVVGVLQLLNCKYGEFTKFDERYLEMLSVHAALALENAELVEKLLQTERISSLGKMANFLIQDIKKPILVSKRYAEHMKSKNPPPEYSQVLDMMLEQLNHVADLVQTTSSYSEGNSIVQSITYKLNETLNEILAKQESIVRIRNCAIVKSFDNDTTVKIDKKEFSIACMHIIRNACDAMPDGGKILVTTKIVKSYVEISFKDNGLGIPDSIKEKIFDPFMSHGKKEGTGLGLSITRSIIENHNGKIDVESDLGEGATFIITLPTF